MPELAMFPVGAVLFPHTPIPLRVFEPRYLTLIGRLLEEEDPEFGIVLIERGHEVGGGDQRADVATVARLMRVAAGAQDLHIVAVGGPRLTIDRWLEDDPYPRAEVHTLPPLTWDDRLQPLRDEAEAVVRRVLSRAAQVREMPWEPDVELSDDPIEAAWQLAAIAPLGEFDQLTLLRATTLGGLLRAILDLTLEVEPIVTAPPVETDDEPGLGA